jgi:phosphatidylglycerophosphatase A
MNLNTIIIYLALLGSQGQQQIPKQPKFVASCEKFLSRAIGNFRVSLCFAQLYNGCLEIIICQKETNNPSKDGEYTSIDEVHKVWIENIILITIIIMFGEALWSGVKCWHDIRKRHSWWTSLPAILCT